MVYGIYQSAAGLQLNQYRQAVLANNLANVDTVGFKHDLTVVRERRVASREQPAGAMGTDPLWERMTGGSLVAPTYTSQTQGMLEETGGRLDVALHGDGFFCVQDGEQVRYTRDGRFAINADGELVTASGRQVLGEGGAPIVVPPTAAGRVRITAGGEVRAGEASFGRVQVVGFDDPNLLRKAGANLYEPLGGAAPGQAHASLRPGFIEKSTVDPAAAMVDMIQVSRAYEMNATLVGLADTTLGKAVNDIARLY